MKRGRERERERRQTGRFGGFECDHNMIDSLDVIRLIKKSWLLIICSISNISSLSSLPLFVFIHSGFLNWSKSRMKIDARLKPVDFMLFVIFAQYLRCIRLNFNFVTFDTLARKRKKGEGESYQTIFGWWKKWKRMNGGEKEWKGRRSYACNMIVVCMNNL